MTDEAWLDRMTWVTADAFALAHRMHEVGERLYPEYYPEDRGRVAEPWSELPIRDKAMMIALATELLAAGVVSAPLVGYLIAGAKRDPETGSPMSGRIDADWDGEIHPDAVSADAAYADLCKRLPGTADSADPREYRLYEVRPAAKVYAGTMDGYALLGPFDSADEMFDALSAESDMRKPRPDRAASVEQAAAKIGSEYSDALRVLGDDPLAARGLAVVCPNCGHDACTSTRTVAACIAPNGCGWSSEDGVPPGHVRPVAR